MKRIALALAVITAASAASAEAVNTHKTFLPGAIKWTAGPSSLPAGAEAAVLYGDPAAAGEFALRIKLPKGYAIAPHTHPKAEVITVISGNLRLGLGPAADKSGLESLPPGSLSVMPAGVVHYVSVDDETVVQVNALGPFAIDYVNPKNDPRLQIAPDLTR